MSDDWGAEDDAAVHPPTTAPLCCPTCAGFMRGSNYEGGIYADDGGWECENDASCEGAVRRPGIGPDG